MRSASRALAALVCAVSVPAIAGDASTRLRDEQAALRAALLRACPTQRPDIERLDAATTPAARAEAFATLDACGAGNEGFLIQYGSALSAAGRFAEAEGVFRRALGLRVTESAQLGLLIALSRQPTLSDAQRRDVTANRAYFAKYPCSRDDLCAALAYAAWHLDDTTTASAAADRAMAMKYPGWQPWFVAGTIDARGDERHQLRAVRLLEEAKRRGGPASAIDSFLEQLAPRGR